MEQKIEELKSLYSTNRFKFYLYLAPLVIIIVVYGVIKLLNYVDTTGINDGIADAEEDEEELNNNIDNANHDADIHINNAQNLENQANDIANDKPEVNENWHLTRKD
jgi:hypothetical protein